MEAAQEQLYAVRLTVKGLAGIVVASSECRDMTGNPRDPPAPQELCALVAVTHGIKNHGTTACSRHLKSSASGQTSDVQKPAYNRFVAVWYEDDRSDVTFETTLPQPSYDRAETSANKIIDLVICLTGNNGMRSSVPIGKAQVPISANRTDGKTYLDVPVQQICDTDFASSPSFRAFNLDVVHNRKNISLSDLCPVYSIDPFGDSVLRVEVEVSQKETNFEVNIAPEQKPAQQVASNHQSSDIISTEDSALGSKNNAMTKRSAKGGKLGNFRMKPFCRSKKSSSKTLEPSEVTPLTSSRIISPSLCKAKCSKGATADAKGDIEIDRVDRLNVIGIVSHSRDGASLKSYPSDEEASFRRSSPNRPSSKNTDKVATFVRTPVKPSPKAPFMPSSPSSKVPFDEQNSLAENSSLMTGGTYDSFLSSGSTYASSAVSVENTYESASILTDEERTSLSLVTEDQTFLSSIEETNPDALSGLFKNIMAFQPCGGMVDAVDKLFEDLDEDENTLATFDTSFRKFMADEEDEKSRQDGVLFDSLCHTQGPACGPPSSADSLYERPFENDASEGAHA